MPSASISVEQPVDPRPVEGVEAAGEGAGEIEGDRRGEEADGAHHPRAGGDDQTRRAERRGDAIAMHRTRAAEGEDRQPPRIAAALQGVHPRRAGHHLVDDLVDPPGGLLDAQPQRLGHVAADRLPRRLDVERHRPAEEEAGIEVAEDEIGVGDGRPRRRRGRSRPARDRLPRNRARP